MFGICPEKYKQSWKTCAEEARFRCESFILVLVLFNIAFFTFFSGKKKGRAKTNQTLRIQSTVQFSSDEDFQEPRFEIRSPKSKNRTPVRGSSTPRRPSDKTKPVHRQSLSRSRDRNSGRTRSKERPAGASKSQRRSRSKRRADVEEAGTRRRASESEKHREGTKSGENQGRKNHDCVADRANKSKESKTSSRTQVLAHDSEDSSEPVREYSGPQTIDNSLVQDTEESSERSKRQSDGAASTVPDSLVLDTEESQLKPSSQSESVCTVPDSFVPDTESVASSGRTSFGSVSVIAESYVPDTSAEPQNFDADIDSDLNEIPDLQEQKESDAVPSATQGETKWKSGKSLKKKKKIRLFDNTSSDEDDAQANVNALLETFVAAEVASQTRRDLDPELSALDNKLFQFLQLRPQQGQKKTLTKSAKSKASQEEKENTASKSKPKALKTKKSKVKTLSEMLNITSDSDVSVNSVQNTVRKKQTPRVEACTPTTIEELSQQLSFLLTDPARTKPSKPTAGACDAAEHCSVSFQVPMVEEDAVDIGNNNESGTTEEPKKRPQVESKDISLQVSLVESPNSIAGGDNSIADGDNSIAGGDNNIAQQTRDNNITGGDNSIAQQTGDNSIAGEDHSIAGADLALQVSLNATPSISDDDAQLEADVSDSASEHYVSLSNSGDEDTAGNADAGPASVYKTTKQTLGWTDKKNLGRRQSRGSHSASFIQPSSAPMSRVGTAAFRKGLNKSGDENVSPQKTGVFCRSLLLQSKKKKKLVRSKRLSKSLNSKQFLTSSCSHRHRTFSKPAGECWFQVQRSSTTLRSLNMSYELASW